MSASRMIERDERTIAVENASYRWGYQFLSFGLLILVAYRSFVYQESSWDLLALVVLGGVLSAAYQGFYKVLSTGWAVSCVLTVAVAGVLAAFMTWVR